jgi:hypothetical protein
MQLPPDERHGSRRLMMPGLECAAARRGGHMNTKRRHHEAVVAAAGFSLLLGAVAWGGTNAVPQLTTVAPAAVVYKGPEVDVALSYRFARANPTGNWLLLDTAMTSAAAPIEIPRAAFAVRTPAGEVVPLATEDAFSAEFGQLAPTIARANLAREPMGYLIPQRFRLLRFFAQRGHGLVFTSVWLDQWHNTYGRLFFRLPDGVQKGHYELLINLPESHVVIPFTI